jgi:hypothetical protein
MQGAESTVPAARPGLASMASMAAHKDVKRLDKDPRALALAVAQLLRHYLLRI